MKVITVNKVPKQVRTDALFTGGTVTAQSIVDESMEKTFSISQVNFAKGARNKMHTHTVNQILIVTVGTGIVATEKEKATVHVGDVIFIPAGEKHWHGATPDSEFSHIYVFPSGNQTTPVEK
jgi:quercetin dioxygenase-like cupin family protein